MVYKQFIRWGCTPPLPKKNSAVKRHLAAFKRVFEANLIHCILKIKLKVPYLRASWQSPFFRHPSKVDSVYSSLRVMGGLGANGTSLTRGVAPKTTPLELSCVPLGLGPQLTKPEKINPPKTKLWQHFLSVPHTPISVMLTDNWVCEVKSVV